MGPQRQYVWSGRASSEGGPVLISDVEDYSFWGGAEERWEEDSVFRVHFYGPLVCRLPARFQPQGPDEWHQNECVATRTAARAYVEQLSAAAKALEPTLASREQRAMTPSELEAKARAFGESAAAQEEWLRSWRDHVEQGVDFSVGEERLLHIDVRPDTDYARGCDALKGDATRVAFGKSGERIGVLWELEGGGIAHVGVAPDGSGFLLLRTWVDREEDQAKARTHAANAAVEQRAAEMEFSSGRVAVVWAPVGAADVAASLRAAARLDSPVQLDQPGMLGVGTQFRVRPGLYHVVCGNHEGEGWSCRWARFIRS